VVVVVFIYLTIVFESLIISRGVYNKEEEKELRK
jgi:hypothetical protein